ncbi:hypothetical protein GUITHDRAFT_148093 [Guillardia theta CCMP2712]|uniref:Uncharacterized protein n=1 Tax=Guillardia theta (strain CCMP2712) TaxID=905079 RepID=L1IBH1_GUITC|nr:hypothetical protein GUITHDRAFT_148093 [Guillardia theta CCMP2712]EKX33185.1 hypothetical protein GUITHDRAFT_148093 [Guillardia theta CCMP2712]|eukprot:XP_005820165.1 hypothetical protein GUITHDRAFT_148093 [Guillardia theta CCMP2712]
MSELTTIHFKSLKILTSSFSGLSFSRLRVLATTNITSMKEMENDFECLEEMDPNQAPVKITRRLEDDVPVRGRSTEAGQGKTRRRTSPVQKIRGDIASAKLIEDRFVQDMSTLKLAPIRVVEGEQQQRRLRSRSAERNQQDTKNLTKLAPSRSQHSYFSKLSRPSSPVQAAPREPVSAERTLILPELNMSRSPSNTSLSSSSGASEPKFKEKTRRLRVNTRDSDAAVARPRGSYSRSPSQTKLEDKVDENDQDASSGISNLSRTPSPSRTNAMLNSRMVRDRSLVSLGSAEKLSSQYDVNDGALVEETRSEYRAEDFSDVVIQQLIEQQRKSMTVLSRCYSGADPFDDVQFV